MYKQRNTPMEKVIGESVKQTNRTFVKSYTEDYCDAITENYKQDHKRSMERMAASDPNSSYPSDELKRIENGTANLMKFEIREGKKYYKIVQVSLTHFKIEMSIGIVQFIHLLTKIQGMYLNLHLGKHLQNTLDLLFKNQRIFGFYLNPEM